VLFLFPNDSFCEQNPKLEIEKTKAKYSTIPKRYILSQEQARNLSRMDWISFRAFGIGLLIVFRVPWPGFPDPSSQFPVPSSKFPVPSPDSALPAGSAEHTGSPRPQIPVAGSVCWAAFDDDGISFGSCVRHRLMAAIHQNHSMDMTNSRKFRRSSQPVQQL